MAIDKIIVKSQVDHHLKTVICQPLIQLRPSQILWHLHVHLPVLRQFGNVDSTGHTRYDFQKKTNIITNKRSLCKCDIVCNM